MGAASPGDYIEAVGTLTFGPGETQKMVTLEVLDDDVFEEDEHFYIRISNLRRKDGKAFSEMSVTGEDGIAKMQPSIQLGTPHMATIMILDDDHGGIFSFDDAEVEVVESVGTFELEALCAILILLARRHPAVGGELGGPKFFKTVSSSIFVFFWCFYVMISALEMYDVIEPGF